MPALKACLPAGREAIMKDEMDILREVSTTASAHGSTALSSMLGKAIHIKLPVLGDMQDERHFLQKTFLTSLASVRWRI